MIDGMVEFDQTLEFDIAVCDLPRMSRLCLAIYAGKGSKKANQRKTGVKPGNKVSHKPGDIMSIKLTFLSILIQTTQRES